MFSPGDVVQLRSGGAKMTVETVEGDEVHCVWTAGSLVKRDVFSSALLKDREEPRIIINMGDG